MNHKAVFLLPLVLASAVFSGGPVLAQCGGVVATDGGDVICKDMVVPFNIEALISAQGAEPPANPPINLFSGPLIDPTGTVKSSDLQARSTYANNVVSVQYANLASGVCPGGGKLDSTQRKAVQQSYVDFLVAIDFTEKVLFGTYSSSAAFDQQVNGMVADALAAATATMGSLCASLKQ